MIEPLYYSNFVMRVKFWLAPVRPALRTQHLVPGSIVFYKALY